MQTPGLGFGSPGFGQGTGQGVGQTTQIVGFGGGGKANLAPSGGFGSGLGMTAGSGGFGQQPPV